MKGRLMIPSLTAILCAANLLHAQVSGQYVEQSGPYTIHYSMVPARLLPDEVKRRHSLPDVGVAFLNVAVRRDAEDLAADIHARATNLVGQPINIEMRRVEENGLISYLGVVDVSNSKVIRVDMTIEPAGSDEQIEIEFEERYLVR